MSSDKLARSPNYRQAASEELIKGRELAVQLEALLRERPPANQEQTSIMNEVMAAISRALVALDCQAKKKRKIHSVQRGVYRRRSHPCTSKTIRSNSVEDGHAWRKYGQKEIHCTKFPRSYFRCTHKYDQDCKAARQVQRTEEDPSLFDITYFGEHTCRDPTEVFSSSCFQGEEASRIIDFASHATAAASASYRRPQLLLPKQDCREEVVSHSPTPTPTPTPGSSSSDCIEFPDLGTLEGSVQLAEEFTGVVSGFEQCFSESLGWDSMEFDFRDALNFEHDVLLWSWDSF